MKILVAIEAPNHRSQAWGRQAQSERTSLAKMVSLLASRIELGQNGGTIAGDLGATLQWKVEDTPAPVDKGEAA